MENELNSKCIQPCICTRDIFRNIVRLCKNKDIIKWESDIYLAFVERDIFPLMELKGDLIIYNVKGMSSIRSYLKDHISANFLGKAKIKLNITDFLNELFSFVKNYRAIGFIHGNLHIDNIFVCKNSFFVIDYANAYNIKRKSAPSYTRTSFIGEYDNKNNVLSLWDYFTLYISLSEFLLKENVESKYTDLLKRLIGEYLDSLQLSQCKQIVKQKLKKNL